MCNPPHRDALLVLGEMSTRFFPESDLIWRLSDGYAYPVDSAGCYVSEDRDDHLRALVQKVARDCLALEDLYASIPIAPYLEGWIGSLVLQRRREIDALLMRADERTSIVDAVADIRLITGETDLASVDVDFHGKLQIRYPGIPRQHPLAAWQEFGQSRVAAIKECVARIALS